MKIFIVVSVDPCGYDSWDVSYHKTRKGALKFIMNCNYNNWMKCRYVIQGGYEEITMYITERELVE